MRAHLPLFVTTICVAVLFLSFVSFLGSPLQVLFPAFFGTIDLNNRADVTLQAPFIPAPTDTRQAIDPTADRNAIHDTRDIPIDQPHRKATIIADWARDLVAQTLTIEDGDLPRHLETIRGFYDPYGFNEMSVYFDQIRFAERVSPAGLRMLAFSTMPPAITQEGVVEGVYKWLVDVPVRISFVPRSLETYRGVSPNAQSIRIRLQIARTDRADHDGLVAERWTLQTEGLATQTPSAVKE